MDISIVLKELNWLAVLVAAFSTFVIGGIWYTVFDKAWTKANGFTEAYLKDRKMAVVFGLSFVLSFVMALTLALFIGKEGVLFGLFAGFMAGFGWVTLAMGVIALFEKRPFSYVLINGGYMVVAFTAMGGILGLWK